MGTMDPVRAARLNANHLMLNLVVDRVRQYVASDATFSGNRGSVRGPRFGVFSLLLRRTPVYVYDHPALKAHCRTAFTDGTYIFFDAEFLEALIEDEKRSIERDGRSKSNVIPILLHELAHILLHHVKDGKGQRLRNVPTGVANIAADIEINQRLLEDFKNTIRFGDRFMETGYGLRKDEWMTFRGKSAETIAKMLMAQNPPPQHPSQASAGSGSGSAGGDREDAGRSTRRRTGKERMRSASQVLSDLRAAADSEKVDNHSIGSRELEKILRENGLGHVADALKLPQNHHEDSRQKRRRELELIDDLKQAAAIREQLSRAGIPMPGGHCEKYATLVIRDLMRPKLTWKSRIENVLIGDGDGQALLEEEPHDLYYVAPEDMNLATEVYLPSTVPAKPDDVILCVIDTSGSVSVTQLRRFVSEIFGLREKHGDLVGDIVIFSADTVIRGEPIEITEDNWRQAMRQIQVFGRGGTSLERSLAQSIEAVRKRCDGRSIRHVLYFTDLIDRPPRRRCLPADLPPVTFLTLTDGRQFVASFEQAVSGFAKVVPIEDGNQVDLSPSSHAPAL